jgi:hypothetical protein
MKEPKEVQFVKLDKDFGYIQDGTTLIQRCILSFIKYFPEEGMYFNNIEIGTIFQVSSNRISHLITDLDRKSFLVILSGQSKCRKIFLNKDHPTLVKITMYHKLHCSKQQSKECLHCYFEHATLVKLTKSYNKENKRKTTKENEGVENEVNSSEHTTARITGSNDSFEEFWAAYPRKVGKAAAQKSWGKLSPDEKLCCEIMAALELHKQQQSWVKDDGQFVPHPATWLNGHRWMDEIQPAGPVVAPIQRDADGYTPRERLLREYSC